MSHSPAAAAPTAATAATSSSPAPAHALSHTLDGRRFVGVVLECGKSAGDADTITFTRGRFRSIACDRYGYGDGAYTAGPVADGGIAFEAETESAKYGLLHWRGVVRGTRLDGTLTVLRDGRPVGEKWILAGQA